jgi:2,3-bisphosphoglycerate-independent phosphoglycerate mutase
MLDGRTVVIGARGAAVGIAQLMGARTVVPRGATGRPGTDLAAKAAAALEALDSDSTRRVVVHVGAPDEAAHERDVEAKVAAIEAADAQLLGPLASALRARCEQPGAGAATLQVCPDHGCDPATGRHDDAPVPCLRWSASERSPTFERPRPFQRPRPLERARPFQRWRPLERMRPARLTERAVMGLPVTDLASVTTATPRARAEGMLA